MSTDLPVCMRPENLKVTPVRQSSCAACAHCKRYVFFRYRAGVSPARPRKVGAASLGTLVHKIMQSGLDAAATLVAEQTLQLESMLDNDPLGEVERSIRTLRDQLSKANAMCTYFRELYPAPDFLQAVCTEQLVSIPFPLSSVGPIALEGTIDLLVYDTRNSAFYIRDFKTTGRPVDYTLTGYAYSLQCRIYRLLALYYLEHEKGFSLPDINLPGFILDTLQVPGIKLSGADRDQAAVEKKNGGVKMEYIGEPKFANYLERCIQWYKDNGKPSANSFYILYSGRPDDAELMRALTSSALLLTTLTFETADRDLTRSHCTAYNRTCDYYPMCSSDPQLWPGLLEQHYEVEEPSDAADETAVDESES